jgi:hypothetical protein
MEMTPMSDRNPRFLLRIPLDHDQVSEAEQKAAAVALWREAMVQLGEDPDKLVNESAQDEHTDN